MLRMLHEMLDKAFPNFNYRTNQKELIIKIIEAIANPEVKYIILDGPTGIGKSWISRQVAEIYNLVTENETLFLTKTISLQTQYIHDFPEMAKLMSASNYDCHSDFPSPIPPKLKFHAGCKYVKSSGLCEYNAARVRFKDSNLKILNYAFLMRGISAYNTTGLMVADEAHNLEESILDSLQLTLNISTLKHETTGAIELESYLPNSDQTKKLNQQVVRAIIEFLSDSIVRLEDLIDEIEKQIDGLIDLKTITKLLEEKLTPLENKLNKFKSIRYTLRMLNGDNFERWDIVFDDENPQCVFHLKPVFIPNNLHKYMFGKVDKVLLMSATAQRIQQSLKLPENQCLTISAPYLFELEHRPIYAFSKMPSLSQAHFEKSIPEYVTTFDGIVDQYPPDTNILVHSTSYKIAEYFKTNSKYASRMIIPDKFQISNLKSVAGNGKIIISPAITEGVDLADGLAKVQFFIKVPYPYLGDSWIERKQFMDDDWYDYKTMLTIIQGSGRGIRGPNDKSDTFILDPSFKRLYFKIQKYIPTWFQSTITFI